MAITLISNPVLIVIGIQINFKKVKLTLCIIILLLNFGISSIQASKSGIVDNYSAPTSSVNPKLSQLEIHAPINITSEIDFIELGFPGNGDQQSPYIIEGLSITGSTDIQKLINIENINSYFIIQNNQFYGNGSVQLDEFLANYDSIQKLIQIQDVYSPFEIRNNYLLGNGSDGIKLDGTNLGTIENNIIDSTNFAFEIIQSKTTIISNTILRSKYGGIKLISSTGSEIINNTLTGSSGFGIDLSVSNSVKISNNHIENINGIGISAGQWWETSVGITVTSNFIKNTKDGIYWEADDSLISQNHIIEAQGNGIYINQYLGDLVSNKKNIISNNSIIDVALYGIVIVSANSDLFLSNNILNSGYSGISISGDLNAGEKTSRYHKFEYNNISNSDDYGIRIGDLSDHNSFTNNIFMKNNNGKSQSYDKSGANTFELNYWDDWIGPDNDDNGIVDLPYEFENNSDTKPKTDPNSIYKISKPESSSSQTTIESKTSETIEEDITENNIIKWSFNVIISGFIALLILRKKSIKS